jgi:hypothetical protein
MRPVGMTIGMPVQHLGQTAGAAWSLRSLLKRRQHWSCSDGAGGPLAHIFNRPKKIARGLRFAQQRFRQMDLEPPLQAKQQFR